MPAVHVNGDLGLYCLQINVIRLNSTISSSSTPNNGRCFILSSLPGVYFTAFYTLRFVAPPQPTPNTVVAPPLLLPIGKYAEGPTATHYTLASS